MFGGFTKDLGIDLGTANSLVYVKGKGMRISAEAYDALSGVVQWNIDRAISRAKDNKRSTVKASDC